MYQHAIEDCKSLISQCVDCEIQNKKGSPQGPPFYNFWRLRAAYFFSSSTVFAVVVVCAGGGGGVGVFPPLMPSLKLRMPSPRPFMTSGMRRPPKKISTIANTTNQWKILNSPITASTQKTMSRRYLHPSAGVLSQQVFTTLSAYRITRSSPVRRVTRCRSRYSSSGMAYFLEMPANSFKAGTPMRSLLDCL